ncbi:MAG: TonB-dependent receptor plug domain-containing protein, partial [Butyricimonas faecalis]
MKKKRNTWYRYGKIPCKKSLCIMRLTLLLMIGFVFQLSATGVAQSVKIEKQLQSLETVFEQVESQTGLLIMFSNNELDVNRKVSLDIRKYTLEELLRKVLEGTNMDFDLEQNYVVIRPARSVAVRDSVVKTNKIKGVVVDAHGEPLPGVTVVAKRGEILVTGAASDGSGRFEIVVPVDIRELSFTFVGYKTAVVPVELNKEMTVRMEEEVSEVDEVVVTGYFTKSKSSYTGAVKSVTAEQLKTVSGTNVVAALAALTPGLNLVERSELGSNPNHVPELLLRGMSSFSDGSTQVNQPTIVLDGVEISMQDLYDLDINEIENITVLKDASATALYGSRAASGVIVVERKKLAEGSMRVSYNFTGNVQFPYLKDYNVLNAAQKLEYERLAGLYSTEVQKDPWGNITNEGEQYALDKLYNERYQEVQRGVDTDWLSQPARTAFSHDHSLRLYGGASNVRYELSGRFNNVQGVMKEDYRRRYNLGFKLEYHLQNKLTMANRTTYSEVNYKQSPYGSFSKYVEMNPYDRIYNEFGEYNRNLSWDMDNPLYEASLGNYDISKDKSFSNTTDFRWEINKLFRLSGNFNITVSNSNNEVSKSPDSQDFKTETELSKKGSLTQ